VPHVLDGVEQAELGAGVRPFPADDEPGPGRVAVGGDEAGQFADLRAVAGIAVGVEGGHPVAGPVFGGQDRLADRFGDRDPDREPGVQAAVAQPADVGEEPLGAAGGVRPDQDRGAVPVGVGDLGQGLVQDGDVIGGGVRPGPAFAQHPGQRFSGVVEEHNSG
jgi:hypothetical protein